MGTSPGRRNQSATAAIRLDALNAIVAQPRRYEQILDLIEVFKPMTICEVGTWSGCRAKEMCVTALKYVDSVHYVGFDVFEDGNDELDDAELNGKTRCAMETVYRLLAETASNHSGFTFELIKGLTSNTLHGKSLAFDFTYIDGGHSVGTIDGDYRALKASRHIVLDDFYTGGKIDTKSYGCNSLVKGLPHLVLPIYDCVKEGDLVQLVMRVSPTVACL